MKRTHRITQVRWGVRRTLGLPGGLLILALLVPSALAQAEEATAALKRAADRFQYGNYADAATLVEGLFTRQSLTSDKDLIEAHRILGLSYFYLGRLDEARSELVRLLSVDPNYVLDPFFHPPKLVEFFDKIKADNESLLKPLRERQARIESERIRAEIARARLLQEEDRRRKAALSPAKLPRIVRVESHHYLLNWLPFGAGQYQNGDTLKGGLLTGAQLLSGAASVLGYVAVASMRRCDPLALPGASLGQPDQSAVRCGIPPDNQNLAGLMSNLKWGAGTLFFGLVVYGIIDAHYYYQPELRLTLDRAEQAQRATPINSDEAPAPSNPVGRRSTQLPPSLSSPASTTPSLQLRILPWAGPKGAGAAFQLSF